MNKEYHTFKLGSQNIAFEKNDYQKIIHYDLYDNSKLLPSIIKCILNDDMDAYPIIDTKKKLKITDTEDIKNSCILIERYFLGKTEFFKAGLLMDNYLGTYYIPAGQVLQPKGALYQNDDYIQGICLINNQVHLIVSSQSIFNSEEMKELYNIYQDYEAEGSYIPVYQNY